MNTKRIEDATLEEVLSQYFRGHAYAELRAITCQAEDGTIILRGRVRKFHLKQLAQSTAARLSGVETVENQIEVINDKQG